ncbi:hypothetical protein ACFZCY_38755 [Streptomyces sp. NPDC007983]
MRPTTAAKPDRSYVDITSFETDMSNFLGALVGVVPRGPVVWTSRKPKP